MQLCRESGVCFTNFRAKEIQSEGKVKKILRRSWYYISYIWQLIRIKPDLVYSNTLFNTGELVLAKLLGKKTIVHVHECHSMFRMMKIRIMISDQVTDKYLHVSHYNKLCFEGYSCSCNSAVIYNGVAPKESEAVVSPDKPLMFGLIGSIDRNKGQLLAVQAIKYLSDHYEAQVFLKIIGKVSDYVYYKELKEFISVHKLENMVEIAGEMVAKADIYGGLYGVIVASADESFGLVAVEASMHGKVVIVSNAGSLPEIVQDNVTGLLFESGSVSALADKVYAVVRDGALAKRLVLSAEKRAEQIFSMEESHLKIESLIRDVINGL